MKKVKMLFAVMFMFGCFVVGGVNSALAATFLPENFVITDTNQNSFAVVFGMTNNTTDLNDYSLFITDGSNTSIGLALSTIGSFVGTDYYRATGSLPYSESNIDPSSPFSFFMTDGDNTSLYAAPSSLVDGGVTFDFNINANTIVNVTVDNIQPAPVPRPATALLFGSGLLGLVGIGRRKNRV